MLFQNALSISLSFNREEWCARESSVCVTPSMVRPLACPTMAQRVLRLTKLNWLKWLKESSPLAEWSQWPRENYAVTLLEFKIWNCSVEPKSLSFLSTKSTWTKRRQSTANWINSVERDRSCMGMYGLPSGSFSSWISLTAMRMILTGFQSKLSKLILVETWSHQRALLSMSLPHHRKTSWTCTVYLVIKKLTLHSLQQSPSPGFLEWCSEIWVTAS